MAPVDPPQHGRFARHLGRAMQALKVGDGLTDTIWPTAREVRSDAALAVYGQGLFWALTAEEEGPLPGSIDEAWRQSPPDLLRRAAGPDVLAHTQDLVLQDVFGRPEMTDIEREADPAAVRQVLRGLIRNLQARRPKPSRVALVRWTRIALVAAVALAAIGLATKLVRGPDLAAGKPVLASSIERDCDVTTGMCQGQPISLIVHTRQEDSPWVRIDLGGVHRISSITVINRSDCCEERAVPLVLEVSMNGLTFTKVAERKEPFSDWKATFAPVMTRYVRARVTRLTVLHLQRIVVR